MQSQFWQRLVQVQHSDEATRRRGQNVIIVALGLIGVSILASIGNLFRPGQEIGLLITAIAIILFVGTVVVARRGQVTAGGLVLVGIILLALVASGVITPQNATTPFFLVVALLVAGVTLRPSGVGLTLLLALAALAIMAFVMGKTPPVAQPTLNTISSSASLCAFAGLAAILGLQSTNRALAAAQQARALAEATASQVTEVNKQLDLRIAERTAALNEALHDQALRAQELEAALTAQRELSEQIVNLSSPMIPVRAQVLVVPLIGTLDSLRSTNLLERLLATIEQQHTRVVFLDVTGVPVIDTHAASALLQTAAAARLLGARLKLVGLRPEVAQALVHVGADLGQIETYATLEQGLNETH